MKRYYLYLMALMLLVCSCGKKAQPGAEGRAVELTRMDLAVFHGDSVDAPAMGLWLQLVGQPDRESYAATPAVKMFSPEVEKVFPAAFDSLDGAWAARLAELVSLPHFYAVVSAFNQSVIVADSIAFIGLNHYLGAEHEAYRGFPEYMRAMKTPSRMPLDVTEALVRARYPEPDSVPRLIDLMVYEGALVEAVMRVNDVDEATAMGYSPDQQQWAEANESRIWERLLTQKWLFATDADRAARLLQPAPGTPLVNAEAPGRLGRWVGHRIVRAYLKANPEATLQSILNNPRELALTYNP